VSLVIDGTSCFESDIRHCDECTEIERDGKKYYQYRLLIASVVNIKTHDTIVIGIEPILNQDGSEKNDCEMNAAKRLLQRLYSYNPWMRYVVIADGLYTAAPIIQQIKSYKWEAIITLTDETMEIFEVANSYFGDKERDFFYSEKFENNSVWFCDTSLAMFWSSLKSQEIYVAKRIVEEIDKTGQVKQGSMSTSFFISTIPLSKTNIKQISRLHRARWGIENTTINNLKNRYNMKHIFVYQSTALVWIFASLAMNLHVIFMLRNHIRLKNKITQESFAKHLAQSLGGLMMFTEIFLLLEN